MNQLLVFFHTPVNTGYAIAPLERVFADVGRRLLGGLDRVHFAYTSLQHDGQLDVPDGITNLLEFDPADRDPANGAAMVEYVEQHDIDAAFGFDQSPQAPWLGAMRKAGVRRIVSYLGAPLSSPNQGLKLLAKKLEVRLRTSSPDHYIFESHAMARSGTHGRGIQADRVSVVHLGIDEDRFSPQAGDPSYVYQHFGIPDDRKVLVYMGHMEERKGVRVLVEAAKELRNRRKRSDFHWLILGNKPGEELPFRALLSGTDAEGHVTFGGYSDRIPQILPACYAGTIASTGWDSFPRSALEMASAGLPLLVSDLQGLPETIEPGQTGHTFPPGNHEALADLVESLLDNEKERARLSENARRRILKDFTIEAQTAKITEICRRVFAIG